MTEVLVLGGTAFVGRAVVDAAIERGFAVTVVNRGITGADRPGVTALRADRNDPQTVASALGCVEYDAVIDVSGLTALQVGTTARLLADRVRSYTLVSTVTTYRPEVLVGGEPITEEAPTLEADPASDALPDMAHYGEQKRGAELAALEVFGAERTLIARSGPILGPHENVHRIPYWLGRVADGGRVLAPGRPDRAFQVVDVRDLARWLVGEALTGTYVDRDERVFNLLNPPGRDTWGDWLSACREATGSDAEFVWVGDEPLIAAEVEVGFGLPLWFARDLAPFDITAATGAGFRPRPLADTAAASWRWLRSEPDPHGGHRPRPISREREQELLDRLVR